MKRWIASLGCAAMLGVAACQQMGARPGAEVAERAEAPVRVPIPEWWVDEPMRDGGEGGRVVVCAMADGDDLLVARGNALERAAAEFRRLTGGPPADEVVETDSVRLAGGLYRAFVRLSGGVRGE